MKRIGVLNYARSRRGSLNLLRRFLLAIMYAMDGLHHAGEKFESLGDLSGLARAEREPRQFSVGKYDPIGRDGEHPVKPKIHIWENLFLG